MRKPTKKVAAVLVGSAIVVATAGAAYAYWTSTGSGSGTATTGTSTAFTVVTTTHSGGPLTPGGPSETVGFTVTNPGSGSQNLSSVVVTVANTDGTAWTAVTGCSAADYAVATPTVTYGQIAAGANKTGTVVISMNNLGSNQDACKGVSVPLYVTAS